MLLVAGVATVRSCQPLCPGEPMPAGSKTYLLLAKAEPIRNMGSASGITDSRRGKNPCTTSARAEE